MGLGVGLYWPATEAAVADLTTLEQRNEAFAITRLADHIGLGLGVVFGGVFIAVWENYRALFIIDGVSFLVFLPLFIWLLLKLINLAIANLILIKDGQSLCAIAVC